MKPIIPVWTNTERTKDLINAIAEDNIIVFLGNHDLSPEVTKDFIDKVLGIPNFEFPCYTFGDHPIALHICSSYFDIDMLNKVMNATEEWDEDDEDTTTIQQESEYDIIVYRTPINKIIFCYFDGCTEYDDDDDDDDDDDSISTEEYIHSEYQVGDLVVDQANNCAKIVRIDDTYVYLQWESMENPEPVPYLPFIENYMLKRKFEELRDEDGESE